MLRCYDGAWLETDRSLLLSLLTYSDNERDRAVIVTNRDAMTHPGEKVTEWYKQYPGSSACYLQIGQWSIYSTCYKPGQ